MRRIIALLVVLAICLTFSPVALASDEVTFNFSENIAYGGAAADWGDYVFFAEEGTGYLSIRSSGCEDSAVICKMPVSSINVYGDRVYFISTEGIYACNTDGSSLKLLFLGEGLSCLYVDGNYCYFLSGHTAYKLERGRANALFTDERMVAFKPVTTDVFEWYADNPDYDECVLSGEECDEVSYIYIKYSYSLSSGTSTPISNDTAAATDYGSEYNGPYTTIGDVTLPLAEYMPGSFFTKNGKACTCHWRSDCVANPAACNCMRYYPTGDPSTCEIDLLSCQCYGFCRLIFYKCFGTIDHEILYPDASYSVGLIGKGYVTANNIKALLMKAKPGAHVRLGFGHSFTILAMDNVGITVYHANASGDGVPYAGCVVSTRYFTWAALAEWAAQGVIFVNMPTVYPEGGGTVYPADPQQTVVGYYVTDYLLNIRSGAGTTYDKTGKQYAQGKLVYVSEIVKTGASAENVWGKTSDGWICLDYCRFITRGIIEPLDDSQFEISGDYVVATGDRISVDTTVNSLVAAGIHVYDASGKQIIGGSLVTTGCELRIEFQGAVIVSKKLVILGDISQNGKHDLGDYLALKRIYFGTYQPTALQKVAADLSRDGVVGPEDWALLLKSIG